MGRGKTRFMVMAVAVVRELAYVRDSVVAFETPIPRYSGGQ